MSVQFLSDQITAIVQETNLSPQDKIEALLKYGLEQLQLQMAIVSYIEGTNYTVKYFSPPDSGLEKEQVFEFPKTYCEITVRLRQAVAINPMYASEHKLHPCYEVFHLEAYIGVPLLVNGRLFGTLNFSSPEARAESFKQTDRALVTALGAAVARLLEQI